MITRFTLRTALTPGQFLAGLTDFAQPAGTARRSTFTVHRRTHSTAEVTERSAWIRERLIYDWSDPQHISVSTIDSNVFGGASGYEYTLTRRADGTTDVGVTIVREGKNMIGSVLSWVLERFGQHVLREVIVQCVRAIEQRYAAKGGRSQQA